MGPTQWERFVGSRRRRWSVQSIPATGQIFSPDCGCGIKCSFNAWLMPFRPTSASLPVAASSIRILVFHCSPGFDFSSIKRRFRSSQGPGSPDGWFYQSVLNTKRSAFYLVEETNGRPKNTIAAAAMVTTSAKLRAGSLWMNCHSPDPVFYCCPQDPPELFAQFAEDIIQIRWLPDRGTRFCFIARCCQ